MGKGGGGGLLRGAEREGDYRGVTHPLQGADWGWLGGSLGARKSRGGWGGCNAQGPRQGVLGVSPMGASWGGMPSAVTWGCQAGRGGMPSAATRGCQAGWGGGGGSHLSGRARTPRTWRSCRWRENRSPPAPGPPPPPWGGSSCTGGRRPGGGGRHTGGEGGHRSVFDPQCPPTALYVSPCSTTR